MGPLVHRNAVVFGKAMIDAHRLESLVAVYPRVAVSSRVYDRFPGAKGDSLTQDIDGIWHLNYFARMLEFVPQAQRSNWITDRQKTMRSNISMFEKAEKWNELSKWSWFRDKFEHEVVSAQPTLQH